MTTAKLDAASLRERTTEELREQLREVAQGQYNLRFRKVTDVVENPSQFKVQRRAYARILTILRERELKAGAGEQPKAEPGKAKTK